MLNKYWTLAAIIALVLVFGRTAWSKPASSQELEVQALSSRPDMVTGGTVLIQITAPGGAASQKVAVTLDGHDVTMVFRPDLAGKSLIGLVEGLAMGRNTLEVADGKAHARLMLMNHPISGPVFSGPHQKPFICQTEAAGLGPALDEDCNAKTVVAYFYKSTQPPVPGARGGRGGQVDGPAPTPAGYKPYDPSAPRPADMAQVTLPSGQVLDYIVRRETGTINRAIYQFAFLHQPGQPLPDPWTVTPGWNRRLVYSFGGGCRAGYHQATVPSALDDKFLSQGYAVSGSSLNVFGNTCDDVISAETLMMVKEYFSKRFGPPVHTMGTGGSGGSIQQYMIVQNYPGLLDGIMPERSSPDQVTMLPGLSDCYLLSHAFETSSQAWTDEQKTAVSGFATWNTCSKNWMPNYIPGFIQATSPAGGGSSCDASIPKTLVYDPASNRTGARCDIYDNQINEYGRDPNTGFARRPLDNVGVQYGLAAFNSGTISANQFVELNERIGGLDADGNIVAARTVADPVALRASYQDGRLNSGAGGMSTTPIIDYRVYVDTTGNIHDRFRSFVSRARLIAANGNAGNQVILTLPAGSGGNVLAIDSARIAEMMRLMDKWLDNIDKDASSNTMQVKVGRDRPSELADACWSPQGEKIVEPQTYDGHGRCNELYPSHAEPRIAAGGPLGDSILKCSLKPVDAKDYKHPPTASQMAMLKAVFPQGVCDYSRPGVEQQKLAGTWQKY